MLLGHLRYLYYLKEVMKTQWLKREELKKLQEEKLRRIVRHAYYNTEFYREKFDSAGLRPEDVNTLNDLKRLPIVYKDDMKENYENKRVIAKGYSEKNCFITHTSGSSGKILHILHNQRAHYYTRAFTIRLFYNFGLTKWDKGGFLIHTNRPPETNGFFQYLRLLRSYHFPAYQSPKDLWREIRRFKPDALQAYAGIWLEVTRLVGKGNEFNPKLIVLVGEKTLPEERRYVSKCFNCQVVDGYPSHEFNLMAWECDRHNGLHINGEGIVLEVVKDSEPVPSGESGEIVITSLENYAMPFIRYNIEDIGSLKEEECPCGRSLPLMDYVEGRKDDFFILPSGRRIQPGQICAAVMAIAEEDHSLLDFMVIQEAKDYIVVKIKTSKDNASEKIDEKVKDSLNKIFPEPLTIEVENVDHILRKVAHKRRKIISKVHK